MNLKRTAMIVLGVGAVAAWYAGAATSNRRAGEAPVFRASPIDRRGEELAGEIARLHERLRPSAAPRQPGRNLFAFHATPIAAAPPVTSPPKAALTEAPIAAAPAPVPLKLAGIGEDPSENGPVRQAFISTNGQLLIVKVGDAVTPRYRVARISADVVELTDLDDGTTRRLALK